MANRTMRAAAVALVAVSLVAPAFGKRTVAQKKAKARSQFETAERMREALNGRPQADRALAQYKRVMDAYRDVYYTAPTSNKADASVVAVAELLAEMGRQFDDPKSLRAAIGQYEFLRKEYPGSRYRVDALFTIGQIYKEDLDDAAQARVAFQEFLKRYPHSEQADEARNALRELDQPSREAKGAKPSKPKQPPDQAGSPVSRTAAPEEKSAVDDEQLPAHRAAGTRVLVTGIRHWSTPDYTRVAIDLGDEVEYEAGRVPNPDRIFFDLHNTHLTSTLVGKSFDVGDGFLRKIRIGQFKAGESRLVLEVEDAAEYSAFLLPNPYRLIVDIHGKRPPQKLAKTEAPKPVPPVKAAPESKPPVESAKREAEPLRNQPEVRKPAPVAPAEAAQDKPAKAASTQTSKVELATSKQPAKIPAEAEAAAPTAKPERSPDAPPARARVKSARKKASEPPLAREAQPTANGDRSLIRALGLKIGRIVIDAGHGGHDTGTIGPNNLLEKDLVLDVALRLGKLLEKRMGAEVVYTRDDDTFIPLETRTAIANQNQADLFISVHANSSRDPGARGVETYYLNFTTSPEALEVAARENAISDKSIHELQDLVKKIALKEKIEESREFAGDVQQSLYSTLASRGLRNRGVKKAPFIVLIGANMPSILAEISFVSNPSDAKRLKTPEYRQKIADALYRGVAKYIGGLSGLKVASKTYAPDQQETTR